jgi:hypothetical protein
MQLFFFATWESAILMSTAVAAVVSCCYGYNSFLLVNKCGLLFCNYQCIKTLLKLLSGFFGNMSNKIIHTESSQIALSVLTH